MTVIRPNSISGVSSITGSGGDISIFRADGTAADVTVNNITSGVITATTFSGNITGNLSGGTISATTGTFSGNLGVAGVLTYEDVTNIDSIGIITARAGINVSGGVITGDGSGLTGVGLGTDGSANTSGIITATAFVPTTGQLSNRNLIINGSMQVAQRGTSSTTSGYGSIDRWNMSYGNADEALTQSKINVAPTEAGAGTAGFRNAFRIQNGNQTSGFGATDYFQFQQMIEDQNIANSGWIVNDPNSFITVSYWIRSSVAQQFFGFVETYDGADWMYGWSTGVLTANVWTKITKTVPGRSNLSWSNDNGAGLLVAPVTLWGTDRTDPSVGNEVWHVYNGGQRTPDATSTWWTTNDATIDITGVQIEVGPVATPFEHRSYGDELARCERYFKVITSFAGVAAAAGAFQGALSYNMRANPSVALNPSGKARITDTAYSDFDIASGASLNDYNVTPTGMRLHVSGFSGLSVQKPMLWITNATNSSDVQLSAEL